jgi:hypothetical protein
VLTVCVRHDVMPTERQSQNEKHKWGTRIKFLSTIETKRLVVLLVRIVVYWRTLQMAKKQ